jgi:hypothetical protein
MQAEIRSKPLIARVADGSPELMPAGSASRAAAGQDSSMRVVGLVLKSFPSQSP